MGRTMVYGSTELMVPRASTHTTDSISTDVWWLFVA